MVKGCGEMEGNKCKRCVREHRRHTLCLSNGVEGLGCMQVRKHLCENWPFNPFLLEFIISAEPLNAGDKMAAPGKPKRVRNATSNAFFRPKR